MITEKVKVMSCSRKVYVRFYPDDRPSTMYEVTLSNYAVLVLDKPLMVDDEFTFTLTPFTVEIPF